MAIYLLHPFLANQLQQLQGKGPLPITPEPTDIIDEFVRKLQVGLEELEKLAPKNPPPAKPPTLPVPATSPKIPIAGVLNILGLLITGYLIYDEALEAREVRENSKGVSDRAIYEANREWLDNECVPSGRTVFECWRHLAETWPQLMDPISMESYGDAKKTLGDFKDPMLGLEAFDPISAKTKDPLPARIQIFSRRDSAIEFAKLAADQNQRIAELGRDLILNSGESEIDRELDRLNKKRLASNNNGRTFALDQIIDDNATPANTQPHEYGRASFSMTADGGDPTTPADGNAGANSAGGVARNLDKFTDPRIRRFLLASRDGPIDYKMLEEIMRSMEPKRRVETIIMLKGHEHLSKDFGLEVAEALQRIVNKEAPRADVNADVILRYNKFKEQGATDETWSGFVKWLKKEPSGIGTIPAYVTGFAMTVPQAILRDLTEKQLGTLQGHKLITLLREVLIDVNSPITDGLAKFATDERVPIDLRKLVLKDAGISLGEGEFVFDKARIDQNSPADLITQKLVSSLVKNINNKHSSNREVMSVYVDYLINP